MQLDLTYLPTEDRMLFSVRGSSDWLVTRSLLIKLLVAWVQKLNEIDLPNVGFPLGERDVAQEHALSLEFDAPKLIDASHAPVQDIKLLQEVTLTVGPLGVKLALRAHDKETCINFTRKESHLVLEMLAQKARKAKWLNAVDIPAWLGSPQNTTP